MLKSYYSQCTEEETNKCPNKITLTVVLVGMQEKTIFTRESGCGYNKTYYNSNEKSK